LIASAIARDGVKRRRFGCERWIAVILCVEGSDPFRADGPQS
jgi:hypothetical protein